MFCIKKFNSITYFLLLLFVLLGGTSCNKNLLDIQPTTEKSLVFTNEAQVRQGVEGAYGMLQRSGLYGANLMVFGEIPSENTYSEVPANDGGVYGQLDLFTTLANNNLIEGTWRDAYACIQQTNVILNRLDGIEMATENRNTYRGEMLFIRALCYFNLVRIYGDVPLNIQETTDVNEYFGQGRTPKADVYTQIEQDLAEAAALLPVEQNPAGKATLGAAWALLGQVYLTLKNYQEAITVLNKVTALNYRLLTDINAIFDPANKNNAEIIFDIQFASGINGNTLGSPAFQLFSPSGSVGGAKGHNLPIRPFYDSYADGDLRKNAYVGLTAAGVPYTKKLVQTSAVIEDGGSNIVVLRYADVLLMLAECHEELGGTDNLQLAMHYLNLVRSRAGLNELISLDQSSLRLVIAQERRWELISEGYRWFDLVRTEQAIPVMNAYFTATPGLQNIRIDEHNLVQPVPQSQINTDPESIIQNPGY